MRYSMISSTSNFEGSVYGLGRGIWEQSFLTAAADIGQF
jgi:hypothetical protein